MHKGLLIWNWFHQRILGINRSAPYSVHFTSIVDGTKNIILPQNATSIKTSFAVSGSCYIKVFDGTTLEIGEGTIWAFGTCIITGNHDLYDRTKHNLASIKIGRDCWLGSKVTILPGVVLGDNVTVGANAVVTKSFPSNVVVAGNPAIIIKEI
jgi:acetyltransferase-like isoleucine patch superfamily enzyme